MTREIILVRHADAEPARAGQRDLARPLSSKGTLEADTAGQWLKQHRASPDCVICSGAQRAVATAQRIVATLGMGQPLIDETIYDATPGDLVRVLDQHTGAASVLIVGHNPGLESLVGLLSEGASDSGRGMPPATIAWLSMPVGAALEPGVAEVRHFWWP
ncbi:MAG: histidine phosphatase family protein [Rhodanobacteraceae bacterium]